MLAMDVVDTLRHQSRVVERELDTQGRRERLIERLRQIYSSQGIEVPDEVIEEGVLALEKDRFAYSPAGGAFNRRLATFYIRRGRWGKRLGGALLLGLLLWGGRYFFFERPGEQALAMLPDEVAARVASIERLSRSDATEEPLDTLRAQAEAALAVDDVEAATRALASLTALQERLESAYELRVVSRPGQPSGVWRVPDVNTGARNYYLVVEAIAPSGEVLSLPVRNEEDGQLYTVDMWGLRVDESIFERFAADKQADGIIDEPTIGSKRAGYLKTDYRVPTTGGAITQW